MPSQRSASNPLRFLSSCGLLLGVAALAASCVDALGLDDRRDAYAETCEVVNRCFGESYVACDTRVAQVQGVDLFLSTAPACVQGCGTVHKCLDFEGICHNLSEQCQVDADCCGFTAGTAACEGGSCCKPYGAACATDGDCCPGQGPCDTTTKTCGGVVCAPPGVACLNDFQCCTGQCSGPAGAKTCADVPCPPVGFACETDADCCDLTCRNGKCADPDDCSLLKEPCGDGGLPCCGTALLCFQPTGAEGICAEKECLPDSSDCFSDQQCCSAHCIPEFKLCGQCVENAGDPCSVAAPCCAPLSCDGSGGNGNGFCVPPPDTP